MTQQMTLLLLFFAATVHSADVNDIGECEATGAKGCSAAFGKEDLADKT
jgi:hypothetical protein